MDRIEGSVVVGLVILAIVIGVGLGYAFQEPQPAVSQNLAGANQAPTVRPTTTTAPAAEPTSQPTAPAATPTASPTAKPSATAQATATPEPTAITQPTAEPTIAPTEPAPTEAALRTYTVKRGDTLGRIARSYGVTVESILAINRIRNPNSLTIGQVLQIPAPASGT